MISTFLGDNFTDQGEMNQTATGPLPLPYGSRVFLLLLSTVIFVVTNIGNGLVVHLVLSMNPAMKTFTNYLIVNKAVSDIFLSFYLLVITADIIVDFISDSPASFSFYYMMLFCSEITLTSITIDRFLAINFPFRRANKFRDHRITIPVLWLLSILVFVINYFISLSDDDFAVTILDFFCIGFVFFLPLFVMIILYSIICHKLWIRKIPGAGEHKSVRHARRAKKRSQKRAIKTMVTVTIVFFIAWAPYMLNMLVYLSTPSYDITFFGTIPFRLIVLLTYVDGALAPVIYFSMSEQFQRALKTTLRKSNIVCLRRVTKQVYREKTSNSTAVDDTILTDIDSRISMKCRLN